MNEYLKKHLFYDDYEDPGAAYKAAAYEKRLYKIEMSTKSWNLKTICLQCGRAGLKAGRRCIVNGREIESHIAHCNRPPCRKKWSEQIREIRNAKI